MTEPPELDVLSAIHDVVAVAVVAALVSLAGLALAFGTLAVFVSHSESLEAAEWFCGFFVGVPLAMVLLRLFSADAERVRLVASLGPPLVLVAGVILAVGHAMSIAKHSVISLPLVTVVIIAVPAAAAVAFRRPILDRLKRDEPHPRRDAGYVAVGCAFGIAAFLPTGTRSVLKLAIGLGAVVVILAGVRYKERFFVDPRLRVVGSVVAAAVLALLVWDVTFGPSQFDHDFFLGPAHDVSHGRYMLVDDYSQYGVVVFSFIAAALHVLSFGYGSFMLLLGILTSLLTVLIFLVLRVATRSNMFAAAGTFAATVAGPIGTVGVVTQYPSVGFLRFGVPWLVVASLVFAYRTDVMSRAWMNVALVALGVASVWSFESAFYAVGTFVIVVLSISWLRQSIREGVRRLAEGAVAVVGAATVFVVATLIGSGSRPHPGGYLDFLRLYSSGGFGTLPIPDWSLGYLICAGYVVSYVGIGAIIVHSRASGVSRAPLVVALTATTTFGALAYTYFLGRSHPNNLTHISPPFVAMVTMWVALAARNWIRDRRSIGAVVVAVGVWSGALLVAGDWSRLTMKVPRSALAAVLSPIDGKRDLSERIRTLLSNPVVDRDTLDVEYLLRGELPSDVPLLILVDPKIATEVLIRLDVVNALPINAPTEDGLVPKRAASLVASAAHVPCGTRVVTQDAPLPLNTLYGVPLVEAVLAELHLHYTFDPVTSKAGYTLSVLRCAGS